MYFHFPTLRQAIQESCFSKNANPVHAAYAGLFTGMYFPVRGIVSLAQQADKIYHAEYEQQPVTAPVLITGNPRSGTTYLHRLLADDTQFSSTKLYQTIFPAVTCYRLFEAAEKLSNRFDKLLVRWRDKVDKKGFGGWQGIHKTQLNGYEEDETFFIWTMLTPVISLMFPWPEKLSSAAWVDDLPPETRRELMATYLDCVKRHLYATGKDKTLLIKNTTLTGRLGTMMEAMPDLRTIHLVRHPYQAIPSLLSMYGVPWRKFAPQTRDDASAYESLARLYARYYRRRIEIFEQKRRDSDGRLIEVRYEDLVRAPLKTVENIYGTLGLELGNTFHERLKQTTEANSRYESRHNYDLEQFGLSEERIYEMMPDVFEFYGFERRLKTRIPAKHPAVAPSAPVPA